MPHVVQDLVDAWESIAPISHAAEWDNVGLLVGSGNWTLHTVFLAIDLGMDVLIEAEQADADAIIAYHPPIFSGLKRFIASDPASAVVLQAAASRIAVFSPHTALGRCSRWHDRLAGRWHRCRRGKSAACGNRAGFA